MKNSIQLTKLRLDGGTQPRVRIDMDVVRDYAERIKAGDDFPPVDVFHDGAEHWLAEGFHRYHAYKEAGHKVVPCTLRKGTVRDAILFSCGANATHGARRRNEDKRKAVETLLGDTEWQAKADNWIAETCIVSVGLVRTVRDELDLNKKIRTTKDGRTISTENRGRPKQIDDPSEPQPKPYKCPSCGGRQQDSEGDCANCHDREPAAEPEPEPSGGYEPIEAKKHLDKLADLISKAAREYAEARKILGPSKGLGAVFAGLDTASIALTKFRNAFKRKAK